MALSDQGIENGDFVMVGDFSDYPFLSIAQLSDYWS
jgi:hypothetical protein